MNLFRVPIKGEVLITAETKNEAFEIAKQMMLDRLPTGYVEVGHFRLTLTEIIDYLVVIFLFVSIPLGMSVVCFVMLFCIGGA